MKRNKSQQYWHSSGNNFTPKSFNFNNTRSSKSNFNSFSRFPFNFSDNPGPGQKLKLYQTLPVRGENQQKWNNYEQSSKTIVNSFHNSWGGPIQIIKQTISSQFYIQVNCIQNLINRSYSTPRIKTLPTPGPGQYIQLVENNRKSQMQKGITINSSEREFRYINKQNTPGPGSYEIKGMGNTISGNMKQKKQQYPPNSKTQNDSLSDIDSLRSFNNLKNQGRIMPKFQKSQRKFEFLDPLNVCQAFRSPGPAQYSYNSTTQSRQSSFSRVKRPEIFQIPKTPGVGAYSKLAVFGKIYPKKKQKTEIKKKYYGEVVDIDFY